MTIHYTSPDNKLVIENYPYGFTLRTTMYMWVETTKKGDRLVTQTVNPKTNKLNKPKKSTYDAVMVIKEHEGKHSSIGISEGWSSLEEIEAFLAKIDTSKLSDKQRDKIKDCIAIAKTQAHVKVTIGGNQTPEERTQVERNLSKIYAFYRSR